MHTENPDAHDEPAKFGRERKMPAADFETEKAGDDGDHQNDASRNGSNPVFNDGSSARIEMKVEAQSAAPVPTEAINSQP